MNVLGLTTLFIGAHYLQITFVMFYVKHKMSLFTGWNLCVCVCVTLKVNCGKFAPLLSSNRIAKIVISKILECARPKLTLLVKPVAMSSWSGFLNKQSSNSTVPQSQGVDTFNLQITCLEFSQHTKLG